MGKLILIASLFIFQNGWGKEIAIGGIPGWSCKELIEFNDDPSNENIIYASILAYLSGLNRGARDSSKNMKIINHNNQDFMIAYVVNECEKSWVSEFDELNLVFLHLDSYYDSLPESE